MNPIAAQLFGVALVAAFGTQLGAHVALIAGLLRAPPIYRAPLAILVPPLAPYWGLQLGMRKRVATWMVSLLVYVSLLVICKII